jgi:hypothetical protein
MAWWPFGKKKPGDGPDEGRRPDVPLTDDPPGFDPGQAALVPQPSAETIGGMTMQVPPPPGAHLSPDPFAAPTSGEDHFSRTLEDPDASAQLAATPTNAADPFAQPTAGRDHFSRTMDDFPAKNLDGPPTTPEAPTVYAPGGGVDPFAPSTGLDPFAPIGTDEAHPGGSGVERTSAMPRPQQMTAPPAGEPPFAPDRNATSTEETAMPANSPPVSLSADKRRLGLALLAGGPITHERLLLELDRSGKSGSVLGKALVQSNFAREEELLALLVAKVRIPKINVKNTKIPLDTIRLLPADVARRTRTLPIEKIGEILVVVSPDIGDESALSAVRQATGCLISPIQCAPDGFDDILEGYYDRLGSSGLGAATPEAAPAPPAPAPVTADAPAAAGGSVLAALPADDGGEDSWDKVFVNAGPIPAEEVLL